jgi:integrase
VAVKCLRACLGAATKQGLLTSNPAALVDKLKMRGESARRAFTVAEVQRILGAAGDSEWRGMILAGIYTGARLGDIARLTWRNVNLESAEVTFTATKTGKRMVLPMARPLADYFERLPSSDDLDAFVFKKAAEAAKRVGTLSNWFYDLMVNAGLAKARQKRRPLDKDGKKIEGKGRNAARPVGELSFHSLRHSAVTFLKAAGVSDALAQAIAGHESAAVSRIYTHLDTETLRSAVDKLPDVTKTALADKGKHQ